MKLVSMLFSLAAAIGSAMADDRHSFSEVRISAPSDLKQQFPDGVMNMPAMFGLPFSHQGRINGELLTPNSRNDEGCTDFSEEDKAAWRAREKEQAVIAVVHRGDCTFVTKVRHVQEMGAQAAIIIDNVNEHGIPYMADDGTGGSISIPSVLINKEQGDIIYPAVTKSMTEQSIANAVFGSISFNIPRPDNRVEWSIWASSTAGNEDGLEDFKRMWGPVGDALGANALLTPHYYFMNGTFQGCATEDHLCRNQCTNNGRYCDVDPDGDLVGGVAGANIVRENLRQICYWQQLNATLDISNYWKYMTQFQENCYDKDAASGDDHAPWENCSFDLMKTLSGTKIANAAKQCIVDSGNYGVEDGVNEIIEAEIKKRNEMYIFLRPTVLVNEQKVIGSIACPKPYNPNTCGVFGAICSGFANASAISACDPDPSPLCKLGEKLDACGVCNGPGAPCPDQCADGLVRDECGVCGGNMTAAECVTDTGKISGGGGGDGDEDKKTVNVGVVVVVALIFLLIIAGGVYWYLKRREDAMREDIDSLLKQYLPMQDGATTA